MTTSSSADQRQDGRSAEPARGVDVTRSNAPHDSGAPAGLPSEFELSQLANQFYGTSPGAGVPTTQGQPGASGAPHSRYPLERDSATKLGISEEQRVHTLLHPPSPSTPLHAGTPSQGSGGSAGGYGRALPATSNSGGAPPFEREGFTPNVQPIELKSPATSSSLLGSTTSGSAIGLEPGRVGTMQQPYSAQSPTHLGQSPSHAGKAAPQSSMRYAHTPAPASGTIPSPNAGPQFPGHSRGGFGRPIPSTPDGAMAHSFPGASLASQAGAPPIVGGPAAATPLASPLAATPVNLSQVANFTQFDDQHLQTLLPAAAPTAPLPASSIPTPGALPQIPGLSRGGFGRPLPSSPDGTFAQSVPGASHGSHAGGAVPLVGDFGSGAGVASPLGPTPLNFSPPTNFTQVEDDRIRGLLPPCIRALDAPSSAGGYGAPAPSTAGAATSPFYFLRERSQAKAADLLVPKAGAKAPSGSAGAPHGVRTGHRVFDNRAIRADFPILFEQVNGKQLVWFDNAATTQKPHAVIQRLVQFYEHENSNIHRAAHELAARATDAYEDARETVARFINAASPKEIVFVRGTTEGINLVAQSWGRQHVREGDEIVLTNLEHHANIVPWQFLAQEKGARILVAPVDDSGQVRLNEFQRLMSRRTQIVAFPQVSNALGTITPAREMIEIAHRYGAKVLVDAAQSIAHMPADVQELDADWFVFSGHKIFAPTGIGAVYGKEGLLGSTLPWQGGGNMIDRVTFEQSTFQPAPNKFEAGTGNIADAVGLGAALQYLEAFGMDVINRYEHELLEYAMDAMRSVNGLTLIGTAKEKASVLSFVLAGHDNEEVGKALNSEGIAVRAGHHCAQPVLRRFGLETSVRPSLAMYNTHDEVDRLVAALHHIQSGGRT